uniref:Putative secreted protein n=1 Tax=Anopheles marajoara TaxID=58244 RepID=A0A2M4C7U7_9DIPT
MLRIFFFRLVLARPPTSSSWKVLVNHGKSQLLKGHRHRHRHHHHLHHHISCSCRASSLLGGAVSQFRLKDLSACYPLVGDSGPGTGFGSTELLALMNDGDTDSERDAIRD